MEIQKHDDLYPHDKERLTAVYQQFVTKDSGKRQDFDTGAVRDTDENKPQYELIPFSPHRRVAELYARGGKKYQPRNWEKGMPFSRVLGSLLRHVYAWAEGERSEDHLAAVIFNSYALMYYEEQILKGLLPADLDDLGVLKEREVYVSPLPVIAEINPVIQIKEGPAPP